MLPAQPAKPDTCEGTAELEDSEASNYHSETEQKLLINMNEGDLPAEMFPPSQTRHQVASRSSRTIHTGGASCLGPLDIGQPNPI